MMEGPEYSSRHIALMRIFLLGQVGSLKICNAFYLLLPDPVIRRTSTDFE